MNVGIHTFLRHRCGPFACCKPALRSSTGHTPTWARCSSKGECKGSSSASSTRDGLLPLVSWVPE